MATACRKLCALPIRRKLCNGRFKASAPLTQFSPNFVRENIWESWDASSRQRLDFSLPSNVRIEEAEPISQADAAEAPSFNVRFSDGCSGRFQVPLAAEKVWARDLVNRPRKLWGSTREGQQTLATVSKDLEHGGRLRFDYRALGDSSVRQQWAEAMHEYGIAIVEGMPVEEDTVIAFAKQMVGYVYPSVYGEKFTVKAVDKPNNLAFSSLGLQMHTDLPFYGTPPSIQLFHSLQQAEEGGESLLLDGFDAATALFEQDPDALQTLTEAKVRFQDLTDTWHLSANHRTIALADDHDVECAKKRHKGPELPQFSRICFNERARDSWRSWSSATNGSESAVNDRFYKALRAFEVLVEQRERYARVLLKPGEMACTDNWRVMHSRSGFQGARHMEGAYIEWDAVYAHWRATNSDAGLGLPTFPSV